MYLFDLFEGSPLAEGKKSCHFELCIVLTIKPDGKTYPQASCCHFQRRLVKTFHADRRNNTRAIDKRNGVLLYIAG